MLQHRHAKIVEVTITDVTKRTAESLAAMQGEDEGRAEISSRRDNGRETTDNFVGTFTEDATGRTASGTANGRNERGNRSRQEPEHEDERHRRLRPPRQLRRGHRARLRRQRQRDDRTMWAWVASFGKPLLCLIEADRQVRAYKYVDDETPAEALAACELLPRGVVVVFDDGEVNDGK